MSSKIRVFVSSTIKDLANERDAVVRKINEFNFEPVNCEGWLPDGSGSWQRIKRELLSSHVFVLLMGERYGWIPDEGPGAAERLSVTEMEANAARDAGIPILPFLKRLPYDAERNSDEAKRRDQFRERVRKWRDGCFTAEFDLAHDLSSKVAAALVSILSESFLRKQVEGHLPNVVPLAPPPVAPSFAPLKLEPDLVECVRARKAVLFAGSGVSLRAGFPSAQALIELLASKMRAKGDQASPGAFGGSMQEVAENFELAYGRESLVATITEGLSAPQDVKPTQAHRLAVSLFNIVLTTNFDGLFEAACKEAGINYTDVADDRNVPLVQDELAIVKIDGSLTDPSSLVLTVRDAAMLRSRKERLWESIARELGRSTLIVVGSSLRDVNSKSLIQLAHARPSGYVVAPNLQSFDIKRIERVGLRPIDSDADAFLEALANEVRRKPSSA
jgi:Domain of unknown function (DUF4062)/SIR2-like domain